MKRMTLLLAVLLASVVLVITGCSGAASPSPSPSPTPLTAATIIANSSEKMLALTSFHFALDQVGGGTPIAMGVEMTSAEGDIVKPDKLKATISGTAMGISLQVQIITTGGKTYMTNPLSGTWEIPPEQFQVLSVFNPSTGIASIMKGMDNLTRLADEPAGNIDCYHVKGDIDSKALSPITGSSVPGTTISTELWIGKADFLVRNIKLAGKITESEKDGIVRTLSLSNFNQPVDIQPPQLSG